jgi:hypothetical protein
MMGQPAFKSKRGSPGSSPDVSPSGARNVGITIEHDGRSNPRAVPSDFGTPYFEQPAAVVPVPLKK